MQHNEGDNQRSLEIPATKQELAQAMATASDVLSSAYIVAEEAGEHSTTQILERDQLSAHPELGAKYNRVQVTYGMQPDETNPAVTTVNATLVFTRFATPGDEGITKVVDMKETASGDPLTPPEVSGFVTSTAGGPETLPERRPRPMSIDYQPTLPPIPNLREFGSPGITRGDVQDVEQALELFGQTHPELREDPDVVTERTVADIELTTEQLARLGVLRDIMSRPAEAAEVPYPATENEPASTGDMRDTVARATEMFLDAWGEAQDAELPTTQYQLDSDRLAGHSLADVYESVVLDFDLEADDAVKVDNSVLTATFTMAPQPGQPENTRATRKVTIREHNLGSRSGAVEGMAVDAVINISTEDSDVFDPVRHIETIEAGTPFILAGGEVSDDGVRVDPRVSARDVQDINQAMDLILVQDPSLELRER